MAAQIQIFRGFFSYAHHDARTYPTFVRAFTDRLENAVSSTLTNASLEIWRDEKGLRTGARWDQKIEQEIRASHILIVLLSPKWIESEYCRKEYTIFEEVEAAEKNYVAPILIRDVENQERYFDDDQKQTFAKLKQRQFVVVLAGDSTRPNIKEVDKIAREISEMVEQLRPVVRGAHAESVEARPRAEDVIDTIVAKTPAGGLGENIVRELARRLKPDEALDIEQAVKEVANAVEIAREVIAKGGQPTNQNAISATASQTLDPITQVATATVSLSEEVAEATARGELDRAAEAVETALGELNRREEESRQTARRTREVLLELGLEQDLLRRDAFAAAARIEAIVAVEVPDNPPWSAAYRKRWDAFYREGDEKGVNLSLEVAAEMARRRLLAARDADQRGAALNLLGTALQTLGERESGSARLQEAVTAYRAALEEMTRDRVPLDWATTQNNLGLALSRLGERESGTARLEEAVLAYRSALEEFSRDRVPLQWAMTENNLGIALRRLGERESGTARLEEAVEAFRAALEEYSRDRAPLQWATTQNNLGNALQSLGERESGTARLEEAVAAYRAALEERTRDRVPLQWATTQMNLGNALQALGERESGTARLEEAVEAFRAALEEYSRDCVPLDWAMTQMNLGGALATLGARESGTARLEEAVEAFRAALEEYSRDRAPLQWATTQNNLGSALMSLGQRESGTQRLEEAVEAFRAALEEYSRDCVPLDWAMSTGNQGLAHMLLAERRSDGEMARQALEQIEVAFATLSNGGHAPFAAIFESHLPQARALVARLAEGGGK